MRRRSQRGSNSRRFTIGYRKLEEWSNQDSYVLTIEIMERMDEFNSLLNSSHLQPDWILHIVAILAKISSISFPGCRNMIIEELLDTDVFHIINNFLTDINHRRRRVAALDLDDFYINLTSFTEIVVEVYPDSDISSLEYTLRLNRTSSNTDNFRNIDIYPTSREILNNYHGDVYANIINTKYRDVAHYLNVQFRLLREDFVAPLRKGISAYRNRMRDTPGVIIHKNVAFISPKAAKDEIGVLVQFTKKKNTRKYAYRKRFMNGSLLCFTKDNFRTIIFGRVVDGNEALLNNGLVVVGLKNGFSMEMFNHTYIMVECLVFFEPYYRVLNALRTMKENNFPMKQYIVDINPRLYCPDYVTNNTCYTVDRTRINLLSYRTWPSASSLGLNDSQYAAFKAALTHKFVVIQGPPGTGKTFLGLKIAKALIENSHAWYQDSPILVVCLTNHALDQFLEGIIKVTDRVVRYGGQSKSEALKPFSLKEKRRDVVFQPHIDRAWRTVKRNMRAYINEVDVISDMLHSISDFDRIVDFDQFKELGSEFTNSWFYNASKTDILFWLYQYSSETERRLLMEKFMQTEDDDDADDLPEEDFDDMLDEQNPNELRLDLDDYLTTNRSNTYASIFSLQDLLKRIEKTERQCNSNRNNRALKKQLNKLREEYRFLKACLERGKPNYKKIKPRNCNLRNPSTMALEDRWNLYFYWLNECRTTLMQQLIEKQTRYRTNFERMLEIHDMEDIQVMKKMLVVGMTTTGAARLQKTLMALASPIVIVEEAAEVLESHIIVSLTKNCEHLLLIGDHQQLRPNVSDYDLETGYNLGISLFERMVNNKIDCHTLLVQHRMRPIISTLIVPAIYTNLINAESVRQFPPVKGVASSLFFLNHNYPEANANKTSKSNLHEARFFIAFAIYLIQCGYKPEDITILAAYSGQMLLMGTERRKHQNVLQNVRITVLDNYQGEESKIILLSLVRNNNDGKIGFLKTQNRVCVALSRAREGLYIMGNMDQLCRSEIWKKIKQPLLIQRCLGSVLTLRCDVQIHHTTHVKVPEDFRNIKGGVCKKICNVGLRCRHKCPLVCHLADRQHINFSCKVTVTEYCENGHESSRLCYQQRQPCHVIITKTLPCSHTHSLECGNNSFLCPVLVTARLLCGHTTRSKPCYAPIESIRCLKSCKAALLCGHRCTQICHYHNDPHHLLYQCRKSCQRINILCSTGEHGCTLKCYEECLVCPVPANKISIDCGHLVTTICGDDTPNRTLCSRPCVQVLRCGHPCKEKCCDPCTTNCLEMIDNPNTSACGHQFKIPCYLVDSNSHSQNILTFCDSACDSILICRHKCSGTCGTCIQGRMHALCDKRCQRNLICGHKCVNVCTDLHSSCSEDCSYSCKHGRCKNKCTEPCSTCPEVCERRCVHVQCTLPCGEICDVPPCDKPCPLDLACGHPCLGFCGDPCPNLCGICSFNEVQAIHFEFSPKRKCTLVLLDECKHVVESVRMDQWLNNNYTNEIVYRKCPKCFTPLTTTQRYRHLLKQVKRDIVLVINDSPKQRNMASDRFWNEKEKVFADLSPIVSGSSRVLLRKIFDGMWWWCQLHLHNNYCLKLMLLQDNIYSYRETLTISSPDARNLAITNLKFLLTKMEDPLTEQRLSNLFQESCRFFRLIQVLQLRDSAGFSTKLEIPKIKELFDEINQLLYTIKPFSAQKDDELKNKIRALSKLVGAVTTVDSQRFLQNELKMYQERWFQCKNGHFKSISASDDQLKKETCFDCGVSILPSSSCSIM